jgi:microcystin-dependent protein
MGQPYVGEIRMFAGNFAPAGWAFCDGQLLPISENDVLFTLIGTTYGGDGLSTFALPDLRGRSPVHQGQGPGIQAPYPMGAVGGVETVTLTQAQLPPHSHALMASGAPATSGAPQGRVLARPAAGQAYLDDMPVMAMNAAALGGTGGSQPHENMAPYLPLSFIISLYGIFPSQA